MEIPLSLPTSSDIFRLGMPFVLVRREWMRKPQSANSVALTSDADALCYRCYSSTTLSALSLTAIFEGVNWVNIYLWTRIDCGKHAPEPGQVS